jgi:hypothetical protein
MLLVLRTVCFMQLLGYWHCITGLSGQRQPWVISRVDYIVELLLLLMIITYIILYISSA